MKRSIFMVFALCLIVTISYGDPPTRNHKLNREVSPGKAVDPETIPAKQVNDISDITLSETKFQKNKAYLLRKTRRPVHVIANPQQEDVYDYKERNRKFKYYKSTRSN